MTVDLSASTAAALSRLGLGDFARVETVERMAWVVYVLKRVADHPDLFPRGKWATIQWIESQVCEAALDAASNVMLARASE